MRTGMDIGRPSAVRHYRGTFDILLDGESEVGIVIDKDDAEVKGK